MLEILSIQVLVFLQLMKDAKSGPSPPLPLSLSPPRKQAYSEGAVKADAEAKANEIVEKECPTKMHEIVGAVDAPMISCESIQQGDSRRES